MDCLALTGTDSALPFAIGLALLLLGGAAVTIVTWRRSRRAGGALLLALVLAFAGGAAVLAPQPAQAATGGCADAGSGDPGAPGTPTTPCTPATAVGDVTADVRGGWQPGDPSSVDLPLDGAGALAWQTALDAVHAIDPTAAFSDGVLTAVSGATTQTRAVAAPGFTGTGGQSPSNAVYVPPTDFDAAVAGLATATVGLDFDLTYPDGCGGTLETHFSTQGAWTAPPPPVCTPATAVGFPAISEGEWFPVDATHEGLVLTAADVAELDDSVAAIDAIDPAAAITVQGVNLYNGDTFATSGWQLSGSTFEVSRAAYDTVVAGIDSGGAAFEAVTYQYSDGCGGTLTTVFSIQGTFPPIIT
jgi:hypothetical protein